MLTFCWIYMHISYKHEVLAFIFIFQKVVYLRPPSHKWNHKQTKIIFHITKFTLSDRTLLNVLMLELKAYCCQDKFYGRSKFGQYDKEKNRVPLLCECRIE